MHPLLAPVRAQNPREEHPHTAGGEWLGTHPLSHTRQTADDVIDWTTAYAHALLRIDRFRDGRGGFSARMFEQAPSPGERQGGGGRGVDAAPVCFEEGLGAGRRARSIYGRKALWRGTMYFLSHTHHAHSTRPLAATRRVTASRALYS